MESYEALVHSGFAGGKPDVSRADVLAWLICAWIRRTRRCRTGTG